MAAHFLTGLQQLKELLDSEDTKKIEHFNKVLLPGLINLDTWASDSWGFWNVLYRYETGHITLQELQQKVDHYLYIAKATWKELKFPDTREQWHNEEQRIMELLK